MIGLKYWERWMVSKLNWEQVVRFVLAKSSCLFLSASFMFVMTMLHHLIWAQCLSREKNVLSEDIISPGKEQYNW